MIKIDQQFCIHLDKLNVTNLLAFETASSFVYTCKLDLLKFKAHTYQRNLIFFRYGIADSYYKAAQW